MAKLTYEDKINIYTSIKQGIEQNQKEIIINMLNENIDINIISKIIGLPKEEILKTSK